MNYWRRLGLFFALALALIGCSNKDNSPITSDETPNTADKPPALTVTIGDVEVKTHRGAYNWEYTDPTTGELEMVKAEALAPNEIINIDKGIMVVVAEPPQLNFEQPPTDYEIKLWDENGVVSTYTDFTQIEETGKYIVEIVAHWQQDQRSTYVIGMDFE